MPADGCSSIGIVLIPSLDIFIHNSMFAFKTAMLHHLSGVLRSLEGFRSYRLYMCSLVLSTHTFTLSFLEVNDVKNHLEPHLFSLRDIRFSSAYHGLDGEVLIFTGSTS